MDKHDRQLISYLARGIPITSTPYRGIAAQLGIDEAELFIRLQRLRDKGSIEAIRASFDGKMLGYRSTLFAARLPAGQTEQAAEQLMHHPGVSTLWRKDHSLALWGVLSMPRSWTFLDYESYLQRKLSAQQMLLMPSLKKFKMGPTLLGEQPYKSAVPEWDAKDKKLIRLFQENFPSVDRPYAKLGDASGLSEADVLDKVQSWIKCGIMKAVSPVFPREIPTPATEVLVAWRVPEEKIDVSGRILARYSKVRQCVSRPLQADWPYSLYVTVQTPTLGIFHEVIRDMENRIGRWPSIHLLTLKEYKRTNLTYFAEEWSSWTEDAVLEQPVLT